MKTRRIGKTALEVTEYSFGTAPLGGLYRPCPRDVGIATLQAAWDHGIRYFDTAPHYGFGQAERYVGDFLRDKPEDSYVLSTKVGRLLAPVPKDQIPNVGFVDPLPFKLVYDYSYDGIMRSVDFSYARLGLNRIDILYVHDIGVYTHGREVNDRYVKQLRDGGYKALDQLKSSGAIKAFGLGVNEVPACLEMMADIDIDVILMAGRYSLLDRSAVEELLPLCEKRGTSITAGGVFNSGILATGAVPGAHFDYTPATDEVLNKVRAMEDLAKQAGKPLAQFAMQFPLHHPAVASVIIGTAKSESLHRNMALTSEELPASAFAPFDAHTLVAPPLGDAPVRE